MGTNQPETPNKFKIHAFGKHVLVYSLGNGLLLIFSFLQLLLIPKYLSVGAYGSWQLFLLYTTYVGVLHLGFIDGILVRWAGKDISGVGDEISTAFKFLVLQQLAVIVLLALLFYFLIDTPLRWLWLMILVYAFIMNLGAFFMYTSQAVRKFGLLTAINVVRGLIFLIAVILLFAIGYFSYENIVVAYLISFALALLVFLYWFRKYLWGKKNAAGSPWAFGIKNCSVGVFILLGNFVVLIFQTIDRLMVSSFFSIEQFAIYAFASTIVIIVYVLARAVSEVFFPYMSLATPVQQRKAYSLGQNIVILAWAISLAGYFPLAKLVEFYLPDYSASLPIMQILLCSISFGGLVQILHVNYYRIYGKQRQYFLWGAIALVVAVALNLLAILIWHTAQSVAIATLVSFGLWYIANELSLRSALLGGRREILKTIAILAGYTGAFWLASLIINSFIFQTLIYLACFSLLTYLFFRQTLRKLISDPTGLKGLYS